MGDLGSVMILQKFIDQKGLIITLQREDSFLLWEIPQ